MRALHRQRRIIVGGNRVRTELLGAAAVDARLSTGQAPLAAGCSSPRISRVAGSIAPPGLKGGLEHNDEDHRLGEIGQTGPEAPGDINRGHPEQTSTEDKARKDSGKV